MPSQLSPGLYVNELDYTQFQQAIGGTVVCLIGGATKGPLNKPTLVASQGDLIAKFGPPVMTDSGLQSAILFLSGGYRLLYVRVADADVETATRNLAGINGGTAAVKASGFVQFNTNTNQPDAETITISDGTTSKIFEFDGDNSIVGGHIGVAIGTTAAATMSNLITAINNSAVQVTATDATTTTPRATIRAKVGGTAANVAITTSVSPSASLIVSGLSSGAAAVAGTSVNVLEIMAATPGSWGNSVQVQITVPSVDTTAPDGSFDLTVIAPPSFGADATIVERFVALTLDSASLRFVDSALLNGIANEVGASRYVNSDALTTGVPTAGTFTLGAGGGVVGADGISGLVAADYVGTISGNVATGLKSVRNAESVEYSVLAIPGVSHEAVIAAAITQAEARADHLYLVDPPIGLSTSDMADWINGNQPSGVPNAPATIVASSYASVSFPWLKTFDPYNKKNVWVPPSAATAQVMAISDSKGGPWLPSAGPNRGVVRGATDLEFSPDQAARDTLYQANVNAFVKFSGGIERYGNKTLQRGISITQSEHARRTLIMAQKLCAGSVRYIMFDPTDAVTWRKFETLCNTALSSIAAQRGLANFAVRCNASTNPPELQAQRVMAGQLVAQPVNVAEQIVMSFASSTTGTAFSNETAGV